MYGINVDRKDTMIDPMIWQSTITLTIMSTERESGLDFELSGRWEFRQTSYGLPGQHLQSSKT